ncbi:MAG: 1-acyl-sn-glycerol-3-phosphate acyltransferase [Trueperaceae bacterium]|nr:MAG: 1-acyl-sn-glycerol-3-phosphate acyltransferase [Trueperaceae bacterium]
MSARPRPYGLAWWRERALHRVHGGIARVLPMVIERSLRRDLAGVWGICEGAAPLSGCVVVANHHSWWDGYLAWFLARRERRRFGVLVDPATLRRYPFFERVGAVDTTALRSAVRAARSGAWLFVFPEGRLGPAGALAPFAPGAATIARLSDVRALPIAWRVVVRGGQYPEVYVRQGDALPPNAGPEGQREAVAGLLARIDADIAAASEPELPLPGYVLWNAGRRSTQERVQGWRRWWGG